MNARDTKKTTTPISSSGGIQIMSSIMDKVNNIVRENGLIGSVFAFLMTLIVYTLIFHPQMINNLIENQINKGQSRVDEVHDIGVKYRDKMNQQIPLLLRQLVENTDAERAMLLETHNGGSSIIGLPFLKISATYEVLSNRFQNDVSQDYILKQYKDEPVSLYQTLFEIIIEKKYILINNIEKNDGIDIMGNYLCKRLRLNDIKSGFFAGIFNIQDGSLIGIIVLTSDNANAFKSEVIASEMVARIQIISYYLNAFNDITLNNFHN